MSISIAAAQPTKKAAAAQRGLFLEFLASRKSMPPKLLKEPGPDQAEIHQMIQAALAAPDHGNLRNWRAVIISKSARPRLADLFEAALREEEPDSSAEEIARAREKAAHAPALLAILLKPVTDNMKTPVEEQYIALGAALENMLLAAESMGYASMITSGRKVKSRALREAFTASADEELLAFVSIGSVDVRWERPKISVEAHLSEWK